MAVTGADKEQVKTNPGMQGRCSWCLAPAHFPTRDISDPLRWVYSCDLCRENVVPCLTCGQNDDEEERGMARDLGADRADRADLCAVCDGLLPQKLWKDVPYNIQLSRAMAKSPVIDLETTRNLKQVPEDAEDV